MGEQKDRYNRKEDGREDDSGVIKGSAIKMCLLNSRGDIYRD